MDFHLDTLLNLQNVTVFSYSSELDYTILKLQLVNDGINCPNCNEYTSTIHQTRSILVRDLSIVGRLVYLKYLAVSFAVIIARNHPLKFYLG